MTQWVFSSSENLLIWHYSLGSRRARTGLWYHQGTVLDWYKINAHVYWTFSLNDSFRGEPNRGYLSCLELEKTFVYLAVPDQSTIFLFAVFLCMMYIYVARGMSVYLSWAMGKIKQINRNVFILMCISKI